MAKQCWPMTNKTISFGECYTEQLSDLNFTAKYTGLCSLRLSSDMLYGTSIKNFIGELRVIDSLTNNIVAITNFNQTYAILFFYVKKGDTYTIEYERYTNENYNASSNEFHISYMEINNGLIPSLNYANLIEVPYTISSSSSSSTYNRNILFNAEEDGYFVIHNKLSSMSNGYKVIISSSFYNISKFRLYHSKISQSIGLSSYYKFFLNKGKNYTILNSGYKTNFVANPEIYMYSFNNKYMGKFNGYGNYTKTQLTKIDESDNSIEYQYSCTDNGILILTFRIDRTDGFKIPITLKTFINGIDNQISGSTFDCTYIAYIDNIVLSDSILMNKNETYRIVLNFENCTDGISINDIDAVFYQF